MALRAFRRRIRAIKDGEPVDASVAGRPDADLQGNLNYLLDLFEDVMVAEGAVRHRVTLDPALLPGQAVYWDVGAQRFAPALADVLADTPGGLITAPSCDAVGIVLFKEHVDLGDVLLAGFGRVDLAQAIQGDGPVLPGRYYLSSSEPGKLTRQRPALSVALLVADGDGGIYVQPAMRDFLEDHVHYEFRLPARPAGGNGGAVVTAPDPALPGWLPAGHASFAGRAPIGAAFGYNLKADPALIAVWPPLPIASAVLFWDKGQGHVGGTVAPKGTNGLVVIDREGIWWMSNAAGDVPWPTNWAPPGVEAPPNAAEGPEDPRLEDMRIDLTFTRMLTVTHKAMVTSLRPAAGSPIVIHDPYGAEAVSGDLCLGLDLEFVEDPELIRGGIAIKELDNDTFRRGWVVEGLRPGANCQLASTHHVEIEPEEGSNDKSYILHQGVVTVDILSDRAGLELSPQIERLGDAQQRYYLDVPFIGFGAGRQSGLRYVFDLPDIGLPAEPLFRMRIRLLARAAGNLPALTMTYRRLPRPAPGVAIPLPGQAAEQALAFLSAGVVVTADSCVEVESDQVPVAAGDTVVVWLGRGGGDGYSGEVGVLRSAGILASAVPAVGP